MSQKDGKNAASLFVAEQYVSAFNKLARTNNTLILPSNVGDITSLVGHAMTIYKTISNNNGNNNNNNPDNENASLLMGDKPSLTAVAENVLASNASPLADTPQQSDTLSMKKLQDYDNKKWEWETGSSTQFRIDFV